MTHLKSVKLWLYALVAAVVSGAAGAVGVIVVDPKDFNLESGLANVCKVAFVMGLIALMNFLKQHPLPDWDGTERREGVSDRRE